MKELLAEIESVLVINLRPHFLSVTYEEGENPFIQIIIANDYKWYEPLEIRISEVFDLLSESIPDILEKYTVVVEPFNDEEFGDIIDYVLDK